MSSVCQLVDDAFVGIEILDWEFGGKFSLGLGWIFENVNVGMEVSFLEWTYQERKEILSDNNLIGVDFEHVLNEASHGKVDFALDIKLIHFGSEFGIVGFCEIGINNVDSDSEGFISLRRSATHVDRCMQELFNRKVKCRNLFSRIWMENNFFRTV